MQYDKLRWKKLSKEKEICGIKILGDSKLSGD